jgi:hypothetical protein
MLVSALDLFDELHHAGVRFEVTGGELHVTAPKGILTHEVKQQIVANKGHLLDLIGSATSVLNRYGVRVIGDIIGLWRVADVPQVRRALKAVGLGEAEVRYLDDPDWDVPPRFRRFVPSLIQQIWDDQGIVGTPEERIAAEWKARQINHICDKLATSPFPSGITAETVLHGERAKGKRKPDVGFPGGKCRVPTTNPTAPSPLESED